ncbi:AraC family transcriptional regulator [Streptomyces beigongshangae]|uniref:AraC family transcriptional regulator n=1 Tax=Streptomyces beigongshangae TaxID=2841597 RepID=UPI0027DEDBF6|nr:AraC family transcriptional regulator [Streptomyces sp. REN17]
MESRISYASSTVGSPLGSSDPIADAIGLLRPRTVIDPGLRAARSWAVRFDAFPHVKIGGVVRGECWLALDGQEPVLLREGDFYLLGNPPSYRMAGSLTAEPQAAEALWETARNGVVRIGPETEEDTYLCGGYFWFDQPNASMLIDVLPRLVHVRATDPRNRLLVHVAELLNSEVENNAVGRSLVLDHLAQILFVHVLRAHAEQTDRPTGWLGALNDDGIGAALRAMHADVAHRWTLQELAGISRMSRSAFAASFKRQVGTAPLEYLIQWRMSLARDALRRNTRSISELAAATGYESESAFSTAFRRVAGSSPRQFRDTAHRVDSGPRQGELAESGTVRR